MNYDNIAKAKITIYFLERKKWILPPRRSYGDSGGDSQQRRQGLLRLPSAILPPPEFDARSLARDEDGRWQGYVHIYETRAQGGR